MNSKRTLFAFAVTVPVCLLVGFYFTLAGPESVVGAAQNPPVVISEPAGWTAFDADITDFVEGAPTVNAVGRFYRASDGSTRQEMRNDKNELSSMRIINIQQKQAFTYIAAGKRWVAQPVVWSGGDSFLPLRIKRKVGSGPGKLARLAEPYESLEAYQRVDQLGGSNIVVAQLNMFPVQSASHDGHVRKYTNIKLRPQAAELFVGPVNGNIERRDKPFELRKIATE